MFCNSMGRRSPSAIISCSSPHRFNSFIPTRYFSSASAEKSTPGGRSSPTTIGRSIAASEDSSFWGVSSTASSPSSSLPSSSISFSTSSSSNTNKSSSATLKLKKPSTSMSLSEDPRLFGVRSHMSLNSSSPNIPSSSKFLTSSHCLRASRETRLSPSHMVSNAFSSSSSSSAIVLSAVMSSSSVFSLSLTTAASLGISSASFELLPSSSSSNMSSISRYT
mmetsp:Transcript_32184/g.47989  ORF Transcript_32184/g.47989 Transcript_32184/m.47989 type:complete len:221 (+) Transcript_32184:1017-1679(+)